MARSTLDSMSVIINALEDCSLEELVLCRDSIEYLIAQKRGNMIYTFDFHQSQSIKTDGKPYLARIIWDDRYSKIERKFIPVPKTEENGVITVSGSYKVSEGEIIEIRFKQTSLNDERYWYVVYQGELVQLAHINNSAKIGKIKEYLMKEIELEDLVDIR